MTIAEQYDTAANEARSAAERSVEIFKQGAQTFSERAATLTGLPPIDLRPAIDRYFGLVQWTMDAHRQFGAAWIEILSWMSGVAEPSGVAAEQTRTIEKVVEDQSEKVTDFAAKQAAKAESLAREQAEKAEAAREVATKAYEKAREPYLNLTKAALSELLAKRELPKSGNIGQLIERLVDADSK